MRLSSATLFNDRFVSFGFLKLNLFGSDSLSNSSMGFIIGLICMSCSILPSLRKLVFSIEINLLFGVGMMVQRFIDSIFEIVFLFAFEKIKQSLILGCHISVEVRLAG